MYGDGVLGVANGLPLFMCAGKVKAFIKRAAKLRALADSAQSDAELRAGAFRDGVTSEAVREILRAVPAIVTIVCQSHSAIGYTDVHIAECIHDLFVPMRGQSLRDCVSTLLGAEGSPKETLRSLAGLVAQLMIEFEKAGANTRLRGSPLLAITVKLLQRMQVLWNPNEKSAVAVFPTAGEGANTSEVASVDVGCFGGACSAAHPSGPDAAAGGSAAAAASTAAAASSAVAATAHGHGRHVTHAGATGDPSFTGTTLEALAAAAAAMNTPAGSTTNRHVFHGSTLSHGTTAHAVCNTPAGTPHHGHRGTLLDTRSVLGVIRLLQLPNEGSGRLDGDGDFEIGEKYEALRESARRVFYLITMEHADGTLRVPEAERRGERDIMRTVWSLWPSSFYP